MEQKYVAVILQCMYTGSTFHVSIRFIILLLLNCYSVPSAIGGSGIL